MLPYELGDELLLLLQRIALERGKELLSSFILLLVQLIDSKALLAVGALDKRVHKIGDMA